MTYYFRPPSIFPESVCYSCGRKHGFREPVHARWTIATCVVCTQDTLVTPSVNFGGIRWFQGARYV